MPEPPILNDLEAQEKILLRAGSGYDREQVVRLALRLCCGYLLEWNRDQFPWDATTSRLTLSFLEEAEQILHEGLQEGEDD